MTYANNQVDLLKLTGISTRLGYVSPPSVKVSDAEAESVIICTDSSTAEKSSYLA